MNIKPIKYFIFSSIAAGSLLFTTIAQAAPIVQDPNVITTLTTNNISIGNFVPTDLVSVGNLGASGMQLRKPAFDALSTMAADMATAGVPIKLTSAYRSYTSQEALYKIGPASLVAKPGFSEHQTGLAVDIGAVLTSGNPGFANTKQYQWLLANAYKYGFALSYPADAQAITGYTYEPWHWRYIGTDNALAWHNSSTVLTTFLAEVPQSYEPTSLVGQVVKSATDDTVYVINNNGTKRGFIDPNAFLSYGFKWTDILKVPDTQISNLPNTVVVKLKGDPTVYKFNTDKTRQAISSVAAFNSLGFTFKDIVEINATELAGYKIGPII